MKNRIIIKSARLLAHPGIFNHTAKPCNLLFENYLLAEMTFPITISSVLHVYCLIDLKGHCHSGFAVFRSSLVLGTKHGSWFHINNIPYKPKREFVCFLFQSNNIACKPKGSVKWVFPGDAICGKKNYLEILPIFFEFQLYSTTKVIIKKRFAFISISTYFSIFKLTGAAPLNY